MANSAAAGGTQAVDRAASLIDLVVRADDPPSLSALSDETGLARSTTSPAARRPRAHRPDRAASHRRVRRGTALRAARRDPGPVAAGGPARPPRPRDPRGEHRRDRASRHRPRHVGGARRPGRVEVPALGPGLEPGRRAGPLLGSRQGAVRLRGLPLPPGRLERRTDRTVTTREALSDELATIRRTGYAVTQDELETGCPRSPRRCAARRA
jgi:hypothetical protein